MYFRVFVKDLGHVKTTIFNNKLCVNFVSSVSVRILQREILNFIQCRLYNWSISKCLVILSTNQNIVLKSWFNKLL